MADSKKNSKRTAKPIKKNSGNRFSQRSATSNQPKVLRIGIIQSGKIIEERIIRKRETVTVGPAEKNTFVIFPKELHSSRFELFETKGGPYLLNFTKYMEGRVSIDGKVFELSKAIANKKAVKKGDFFQLQLDEQARGKIVIGDITVLFQFIDSPPIQPRPQLPAAVKGSVFAGFELVITILMMVSFSLHLAIILYFELNDWPKQTLAEKYLILEKLINANSATFEKPKKTTDEKADEEGDKEAEEEAAEEEVKPQKVAKKQPAKVEDTGPKKSAEEIAKERAERRAELAEQIAQTGINKILGSLGGSGEGAIADVLRGGDVGADQDDLLSQVSGVGVATGEIGGKLKGPSGGKGSGEAADISQIKVAGGDKTVKTAGPAKEKKISGRVRKKKPVASGGTGMMSSSDVSKVVNRKIGAIKGCYEQALKRNPSLKGKITIRFTISGSGKVTTARATLNELNPQVGNCITRAFKRFRFPPPEGGTVTFEYPFLFTPAN
jgi:outer membrane biosynthesis protein TonB